MVCEVICVGTELLLGSIVNTNAAFISEKLSGMGVSLYKQTVVGDNSNRIKEALKLAFQSADLVVMCGGLGPTQDDITKEAACEFFEQEPILHEPSLERLKTYFTDRPISKFNLKQAMFPNHSIVIDNDNGTAPGAILINGNKRIVLLPGPPNELQPMFEKVCQILSGYQKGIFLSKELKMFGIGESTMVEVIEDIIDNQTNPTIAPYAGDGEVKLRLTASADTEVEALTMILPVEHQIRERLEQYIYGINDDTLESVAVKRLIQESLTISTAESCTGGLLASSIVDISGASEIFKGGLITYSNEEKIKRLQIDEMLINKYGAVSSQVAQAMASATCATIGTNVSLSTTGIAGPGGGTIDKPVGTVFIGLCFNGQTTSKQFLFKGNRKKVRTRTVKAALKMLLDKINSENCSNN